MLVKLTPPLVDRCQRTAGVGAPEDAAENVAVWLAVRVWLVGWVVILGTVPGPGPPPRPCRVLGPEDVALRVAMAGASCLRVHRERITPSGGWATLG